MAIRSKFLEAIEESRLSVIIFARDCASLTWCFDEFVKMVRFMDETRSDIVFPVSYDVKQSMIDDQTRRYTIVFDKVEENCRDDAKMKRWMNILTGVENDEKSRPKYLKSKHDTGSLLVPLQMEKRAKETQPSLSSYADGGSAPSEDATANE
ncbi:hypothetical protein OIU76_028121 [Salix suchowensis]|nr:hypothetical protein OIU76_028121 [Salix suchowensis]